MQRFTYPVSLSRDEDDGGYVVTCRDVPEVPALERALHAMGKRVELVVV